MTKALLLLSLLLPIAALAQSPYTIKGKGQAFNNGDMLYLIYKVNDKVKFDSVIAMNHTFEFKGMINGIVSASLYQNENPMQIEVAHNSAALYIEPGTILVSAADSVKHATISGTSTNTDLATKTKLLKILQDRYVKLDAGFEALPDDQQKNIEIVADFRKRRQVIWGEMEPVKLGFIGAHPNSYISLVTVGELMRNGAPTQKVAAAFASLSPGVKATPLGKKMAVDMVGQVRSAINVAAPDFTMADVNGKPVNLSGMRGKYVLIDFWASWCLPCRAENPNVILAYNKYKSKGFTVLGVSLDERSTKNAWLKAIKDDGLVWTQVSDLKGWKNEAAILYGVTSIPANVLIDPTGKIIAKDVKDKVLLDKLAELLDK